MNRSPLNRTVLLAVFAVLGTAMSPSPSALVAQDAEPDGRVLTITVFHVPMGKPYRAALAYLDAYSVPAARENPHLLDFRYATHGWGDASANLWIIHEYASLAAVEKAEAWGSAWFEENFPAGTPERQEADRAFEEDFAPYLSSHEDHILMVSAERAGFGP